MGFEPKVQVASPAHFIGLKALSLSSSTAKFLNSFRNESVRSRVALSGRISSGSFLWPLLAQPTDEIRGTKQFATKLSSLSQKDELRNSVDACLEELKLNALAGVRIPRNLWPKEYVRNYGITNLYKYNLAGAYRLLYTIYAEANKVKVLAIDFMSHKEYEKLFGY